MQGKSFARIFHFIADMRRAKAAGITVMNEIGRPELTIFMLLR